MTQDVAFQFVNTLRCTCIANARIGSTSILHCVQRNILHNIVNQAKLTHTCMHKYLFLKSKSAILSCLHHWPFVYLVGHFGENGKWPATLCSCNFTHSDTTKFLIKKGGRKKTKSNFPFLFKKNQNVPKGGGLRYCCVQFYQLNEITRLIFLVQKMTRLWIKKKYFSSQQRWDWLQ